MQSICGLFRRSCAVQAWYAPHPPRRGTAFTPTRPYVHQGFLKTWHANGLNVKVLSRVKEIVEALRDEGRAVHLYITGESCDACAVPAFVHPLCQLLWS